MNSNKRRSTGIIGLVIILSNFSCIFSFLLLNFILGERVEVLCSVLSLLISFVAIPYIVIKKTHHVTLRDVGVKKTKVTDKRLAIVVILFLIMISVIKVDVARNIGIIIQQLFVSLTEEFLMRGIVLFLLMQILKKKYEIVCVNAIIFAFLLHTGGDVINNLVYRFPAGIILVLITLKTKSLYLAIIVHFVYNLWCICG